MTRRADASGDVAKPRDVAEARTFTTSDEAVVDRDGCEV
jgi:hypothetical protein